MAAMKSPAALKLQLPANLGPRLLWQSRRGARRLGAGAIAGAAALLLSGLALWHGTVLERQGQTLNLQLRAAARAAQSAPVMPVANDADSVAAFYRYLPAHEAIPDQLKELVEVAQKSGLTLAKAEYKAQAETRAGFLRYEITLPVKADYANVQTFIISALQAMPTLTLDSVAFKREQIETGDIDARIQFVLLVRQREVRR
ncbi:type 4a pilus biogenesis protein PilO [Oxalobacteraceae bacterium]|nr:type 4a pilus biogenesis protein PilO [Oxalobacteraceae bacterium]